LLVRPDLDAAAQVIALGAVDPSGAYMSFIQDVSCIQVTQPYMPLARRQNYAAAIVEIEPNALRTELRR
jgi:hypothetical protein